MKEVSLGPDCALIYSLMLFPGDRDSATDFVTYGLVKTFTGKVEGDRELVEGLPKFIVENLLMGPSGPRRCEIYADREQRGLMIGQVYLSVYGMSTVRARGASLNEAIQWLIDEGMPFSKATVMKYWTPYKKVAHLWAAYLSLCKAKAPENWLDLIMNEHFGTFLWQAEVYRCWAAKFVPSGAKHPLVSSDESWPVPDELIEVPDESLNLVFPDLK